MIEEDHSLLFFLWQKIKGNRVTQLIWVCPDKLPPQFSLNNSHSIYDSFNTYSVMVIHNSHHPTTKRTGLGSSDKEFLVYLTIKIEHYINIANW